jgi:DegT/DnrJ/EryC1/StrS aminotransferase family
LPISPDVILGYNVVFYREGLVNLYGCCVGDETKIGILIEIQKNSIETGLHYPLPIHRQPCLATLEIDRSSYPVTDTYAIGCLSLPNPDSYDPSPPGDVQASVRFDLLAFPPNVFVYIWEWNPDDQTC